MFVQQSALVTIRMVILNEEKSVLIRLRDVEIAVAQEELTEIVRM